MVVEGLVRLEDIGLKLGNATSGPRELAVGVSWPITQFAARRAQANAASTSQRWSNHLE